MADKSTISDARIEREQQSLDEFEDDEDDVRTNPEQDND